MKTDDKALSKQGHPGGGVVGMEQWNLWREQAVVLIKSGFLPVAIKLPEQAIAVMMVARELGIGIMSAFRTVYIINGAPTVAPKLMLALVNKTGQLEDIKIEKLTDRVRVTITRKGRTPHVEEFGKMQADKLFLSGKDNYQKQALTMYTWRAISANLNVTFPDVLFGVFTPEELGADVVISPDNELDVKEVRQAGTEDAAMAKKLSIEIIRALSILREGNVDAMAYDLKNLTLHKIGDQEVWIDIDDLPELALSKPSWIKALHAKAMPQIEIWRKQEIVRITTEQKNGGPK